VLVLREQPRQRHLHRRHAERRRQPVDAFRQRDVAAQVLALELRQAAAEVVVRQVAHRVQVAGQHASADRRVRDHAHAQLDGGRQDRVRQIAVEQ
jgi:hypothetical protein